jgi:hypothetical protein
MGDAKRFAATKGCKRNLGLNDEARHMQRLIARELIAPRLVGTGLLTAGRALCVAVVRQLPRNEQGSVVLLYGAPRHHRRLPQDQVKRMYG